MKPVGHVGSLKQTHKNVDYSHLDQKDRYATTRTIDRFLNATTRRERERERDVREGSLIKADDILTINLLCGPFSHEPLTSETHEWENIPDHLWT